MSISAINAVTGWSKAKRGTRMVLICIAQFVQPHSNRTGWLSIRCIAERSGYSRSQVIRIIKELEDLGELEVIVPDTTGGPGYARARWNVGTATGYKGANGRSLANAYRIRLSKESHDDTFYDKGVILTPDDEKGVISEAKRCQNEGEKGVTAMDHHSIHRISKDGGGTPPLAPSDESPAPFGSVGASATPSPQADPEVEARTRRLAGKLTGIESQLIASGRRMVGPDGSFLKVKAG